MQTIKNMAKLCRVFHEMELRVIFGKELAGVDNEAVGVEVCVEVLWAF